MSGGAEAQIGFKSEVTPGTAVVVDTFMPFVSENIKNNINYLDTQTKSARRTLRLTKQGSKGITGGFTTELPNTDLATLLKHMFGDVATTGAGPYEHTYTPDSLDGKALTIQVGRPASSGTVHPFTYAGCKIANWTISADVDAIAQLQCGIVGMTETTATALAAASYDATWEPFVFTEASMTIDGTSVGTVRSGSLTCDNAVQPRIRWGSGFSKEPTQNGLSTFTGTVTTDFDSLTHYELFTAGTETAMVWTFDNGAETLVITMNVMFSGETPEVSDFDLLPQNLPFRAFSQTSDAAAITAVLTNSEASAA
jgi:hypothetical protein